jgi:rhodanese-related sulfurtransferase
MLPDETVLYPTHGGGSFCSTGAGGERVSTLGRERRENPVLSRKDESDFVRWFPSTFPAVPDYFFRLRAVNQSGPTLRRDIREPLPLQPDEFAAVQDACIVVDVRSKEEYAEGHLAGSLSNVYRDAFAIWLGWLVPVDSSLLFVTDGTPIERLVDESLLVGYERFAGWLEGGVDAWQSSGRALERVRLVNAGQANRYLVEGAASLDVRESDEYDAGHIPEAIHVPLGNLSANMDLIPRDRPVVVYCGHGERASTAVSLLEAEGLQDLVNLDGGMGAWSDSGFRISR